VGQVSLPCIVQHARDCLSSRPGQLTVAAMFGMRVAGEPQLTTECVCVSPWPPPPHTTTKAALLCQGLQSNKEHPC
jgi:hypothetical protein